MHNALPIFKPWVPEWLIKIILFSILLPSTVLFFLPLTNLQAAAGHYGSEPADMQFAVAIFYAGYAGFYSLERRFFDYLATKEYFLIFTLLQIVTTYICYHTHQLYVLFPIRFLQGMLFTCTVNLSLSVIFSRLHSERAREIGFSVFFCMLLCAMPFNNLVTADLIDAFNFNIVYQGAVFSYLPGFVMLLISMNNVRRNVRFHLQKLDWQSFVFYSVILMLIGYTCIFGQEYYWLEDPRILYSVLTIIAFVIIFSLRQRSLKRPYMNLEILKSRNFLIGLFLLFVMYICRFASGITNTYFASVLKFDPMHVSYMNAFNLMGIIMGVIIAGSMILQRKSIRHIWLAGFLFLLVFHIAMYFLFDIQADEFNYFVPLLLQGLGVGMIMVPTIIYAISSVTPVFGPSAAALCLAVRFFGFCISIAIINYAELFEKSRHYNAFQDHLTKLDPTVAHSFALRSANLMHRGMPAGRSAKAAVKLLVNNINEQSHLRFAMDYYEMMALLLILTLILVALFPYLNKTVVYLKSKTLTPS